MRVVVVAIDVAAVFDFAFEAVDGEVQEAEASSGGVLLNGVDAKFRGGVLLCIACLRTRHDERNVATEPDVHSNTFASSWMIAPSVAGYNVLWTAAWTQR